MPQTATPEALRCSFCSKDQLEVVRLVAGPGVLICNECIDLCNQVIAEEIKLAGGQAVAMRAEPIRRTSCNQGLGRAIGR